MTSTEIIFICLYRFFDPNSERTIWLLKLAEYIPLTYGRRLLSILSYNMIVFFRFLSFLYLKLVLAEKNKMACTKIIFICSYRSLGAQLRRDNRDLKMSRMYSLTYRRSLSSVLSRNMIVFSSFLDCCI